MLVRYRYRCYPEPVQKILLAKAFDCARVVRNDALALNRQTYEEENKLFDAGGADEALHYSGKADQREELAC